VNSSFSPALASGFAAICVVNTCSCGYCYDYNRFYGSFIINHLSCTTAPVIADYPSTAPSFGLFSRQPSSQPSTVPSVQPVVKNNISPLERQALQDLYDSTDGPNWYNYNSYTRWDFSNPYVNPCDEGWYGVTCSLDYHITSLYLSYRNLIGTIPSTIGQLSSLQYLFLSSNHLIGSIPSTIGQLSSLQALVLSYNQLTGVIPSTLGQLSSLYYLYLPYNNLIGTIPDTIGQLTSLNYLDLNNNHLTGNISETISHLSSLRYLYYVHLADNQLTGTIPSTISQFLCEYLYKKNNLYLYKKNNL
jgi:hypothetical protein